MAESSRANFIAKASLLGFAAAASVASAYALHRSHFFRNRCIPISSFSASTEGDGVGSSLLHDPQYYEDLMAKIHMLDR